MPRKTTLDRSKVKGCVLFLRKLETLAREHGLTQLSEKSEIHPTYFSHIFSERGNPTLDSLVRLADALGYTIELRKKS